MVAESGDPLRPGVPVRFNRTQYMAQHMRTVIHGWVPHVPSSQEVEDIRRDSDNRRQTIQALEDAKCRLAPGVDTGLDTKLFLSRLDYWIRFTRIFRVNNLPTEIIANIFRYVVWSSATPHSGIVARLRLTWTCRCWRTIAIEDSTLWNAIWFRDHPPFARSLAWLDRSGTAPLDLRINDKPDHKFTDKDMEQLLDRVLTKLPYIRMLIVIVEAWEPVLIVLDKLRTAAKSGISVNIERFELHRTGSPYVQIGEGYQPSAFRHPMALFGGVPAPSLKYFSINGVHVDWLKSDLSNLTTIDIRRMPLERSPGLLRFRELLANSPALRKLCLDGAGPQWNPEDSARGLQPVKLPHLKILVIADFSLNYGVYVLSHISAPNVRDLTFMNFVGEDYSPLFGLITSGFPEVRLLTVYSVEAVVTPQGAGRMVKWLESMPLLSYLRIANIQKRFLQLFLCDPPAIPSDPPTAQNAISATSSAPSSRRLLCPLLTVLECQAVDPDMISAWALARRNIGAPLQKIYVNRDMAMKMRPHQHKALIDLASLSCLEQGGKTPEEILILE